MALPDFPLLGKLVAQREPPAVAGIAAGRPTNKFLF